ncbi:MAG: response regulator [Elusimicrobiota bacterium]
MYRILSVEDDPMMQKLLQTALVAAGYEFRLSEDGRSALAAALSEKPDLILLDVNLPDMTGIEICRALKAEPKTRHIPVLMLTGEAREIVTRVEGLDVGAEDYMFKPISPRVLIARISSILKQAAKPTQL